MSIPLDNLHHWISSMLPDPSRVYLFYPHGTRNISNLIPSCSQETKDLLMPTVILHDQEPLNYSYYENACSAFPDWMLDEHGNVRQNYIVPVTDQDRYVLASRQAIQELYPDANLEYLRLMDGFQLYDSSVLIHSEKNSKDLQRYQQQGYTCVHYWSHAVISLDWYRFAKFDKSLLLSDIKKTFLIYCRDWSNNREYRLKFLDLLINAGLLDHSMVKLMHVNSDGVHFQDHKFLNSDFDIIDRAKLFSIEQNTVASHASAGYHARDFINTNISVVLETVFDDPRIHLTEKTLRPIACGHPFILAAGPGSLEYLKSYGFRTFEPWIDESYDREPNSLRRLELVIQSMSKLEKLSPRDMQQIKNIAMYNQQHFFSNQFFNSVKQELETNLAVGWRDLYKSKGKKFATIQQWLANHNVKETEEIARCNQLFRNAID